MSHSIEAIAEAIKLVGEVGGFIDKYPSGLVDITYYEQHEMRCTEAELDEAYCMLHREREEKVKKLYQQKQEYEKALTAIEYEIDCLTK